jgi:hypothetical protein
MMHPARFHVKWRRTTLALTLALGVVLPPPAQAYLLDFTVVSINPGVLISHAAGFPSRPSAAESRLQVTDLSHIGDIGPQRSCIIAPHNRISNFPTGPLIDYFSAVLSAPPAWMFGGISHLGSIALQNGIPGLDMPDGATLLRGSMRAVSVKEPAPAREDWFLYAAGSDSSDDNNDGWLTFSGMYRPAAHDNLGPGCAFTPVGFTCATAPNGNILHYLAPFSSTLLLLGCGLMGLAGLHYRRRRG